MLKAIGILVLIGLAVKVQATCQLCMQTYKTNCSICYDKCSQQKNLTKCTYNSCTAYDENGNCKARSPIAMNSSNCLGTCCGSTFAPTTPFTEINFNLCIERDAYQTDNVNIGLTIGLILSLLALLFFAGLACLLVIMFCDDKESPTEQILTGENINTQRFKNSDGNSDDEWMSDGYILNGMCQICSAGISNVSANCGHCYHYSCLCRNLNVSGQQRCPLCGQPDSLKRTKIFCSSCKKQYKIIKSEKDKYLLQSAAVMEGLKCPNCA